jgi:hypothetical protein
MTKHQAYIRALESILQEVRAGKDITEKMLARRIAMARQLDLLSQERGRLAEETPASEESS